MPRHILLDPELVALPSVNSSEDFRIYCDRLHSWGSVLLREPDSFSISEHVIRRLLDEKRYPTYQSLVMMLKTHRIDEYTAYDLQSYVKVLSERRPYLEERYDVRSVIVDTTTGITPPSIVVRQGATVGAALHDSFFLAVVAVVRGWDADPLWFGAAPIEEQCAAVSAKGNVSMVECVESIVEVVIPVEFQFVIVAPESLEPASEDIMDLVFDPPKAVHWTAAQLRTIVGGQPLPEIRIGPDFLDSIRRHGIHNRRGLVVKLYHQACLAAFDRLKDIAGADLHPVRESAAADSAQVTRGGDRKWRCKISQHGAGYRLQYWSLAAGGIELEGVMKESEVY